MALPNSYPVSQLLSKQNTIIVSMADSIVTVSGSTVTVDFGDTALAVANIDAIMQLDDSVPAAVLAIARASLTSLTAGVLTFTAGAAPAANDRFVITYHN